MSHAPTAEPRGAGASSGTVVGPGARFVGDLFCDENVLVSGKLEGRICGRGEIEIGPTGDVHGDVEARAIRVAGRVRGEIRASERAELGSSAVVLGKLQAPKIVIAEGAQLQGDVAMTGESAGSHKKTEE